MTKKEEKDFIDAVNEIPGGGSTPPPALANDEFTNAVNSIPKMDTPEAEL